METLINADSDNSTMIIKHIFGTFPLSMACEYNAPVEIIRLLVQKSPKDYLTMKDNFGRTPWGSLSLERRQQVMGETSTTTFQTGGVDDSPLNASDRLGYEVYAEALFNHVETVETKGNETFCVGLYGPWGSGKSFLWECIQREIIKKSDIPKPKEEESVFILALVPFCRFANETIRLFYKTPCLLPYVDRESQLWRDNEVTRVSSVLAILLVLLFWVPFYVTFLILIGFSRAVYSTDNKEYDSPKSRRERLLRRVGWCLLLVIFTPIWIPCWIFVLVLCGFYNSLQLGLYGGIVGLTEYVLLQWILLLVITVVSMPLFFIPYTIRYFGRGFYQLLWKGLASNNFPTSRTSLYSIIVSRLFPEMSNDTPMMHIIDKVNAIMKELPIDCPLPISCECNKQQIDLAQSVQMKLNTFCPVQVILFPIKLIVSALTLLFKILTFSYFPEVYKKVPQDKPLTRIIVKFNSWTYRGADNLWASMMLNLWKAVEDEFDKDTVTWHRVGVELAELSDSESDLNAKEKARERAREQFRSYLNVIMWWGTVFLLTALVVGTIFIIEAVRGTKESEKTLKAGTSVFMISIFTIGSVMSFVTTFLNFQKKVKPGFSYIEEKLAKYDRKDFKTEAGFMAVVQNEIRYLFDLVESRRARIELGVDDPDRLEKKLAMDLLWAIRLLLDNGPISCWLLVDCGVLVDYIEQEFEGTKINGYQFIQKIVQLPFSIPDMSDDLKISFCERIADTPELTASQVYDKCFDSYNSIKCPRFVTDMDLKNHYGDDNKMMKELVNVAQSMNNDPRFQAKESKFDTDMLDVEKMANNSSTREGFLSKILNNFRDEKDNVYSVYTELYSLIRDEPWLEEELKCLKGPYVHNRGFLLKSDDELLEELRVLSKSETESKLIDFKVFQQNDHDNSTSDDEILSQVRKFTENLKSSCKFTEDLKSNIDPSFVNANEEATAVSKYTVVSPPNGSQQTVVTTENASNAPDRTYESKCILNEKELKWLKIYAPYFHGIPRQMKRIINVYNITRYIVEKRRGTKCDDHFLQKLFVFTILQELWPYRTSWLVKIADYSSRQHGTKQKTSLYSMIQDLSPQQNNKLPEIPLVDVYTKIVQSLMYSLPKAASLMEADSGSTTEYEELLECFVLNDLFSENLRPYTFNLPRHIMNEIRKFDDICSPVKSTRSASLTHGDDQNQWHASYRRKSLLYDQSDNTFQHTIEGWN